MQLVVILVRFGQAIFVQKQTFKTIHVAQLEFRVHLDGFERTYFHANLAAHADGHIDVEDFGVLLRAAFLVTFEHDVNTLGWTVLLANLTRDAAQSFFRVVAVEDQKRKVAGVLLKGLAFFRIFDRDQARLIGVAADEVPRRFDKTFGNAFADHRSTSPSTMSTLPRITTTSATV